jgi:ubiquinone/menaquinone biosynthesis C-methylase UbiE
MNCSTDRYAELYAPWLATAPQFAERFISPGDRVLDLCGGTGVVGRAAIAMGCWDVTVLDINPRVAPKMDRLGVLTGDANHLVWYMEESHNLDVIVCRQALGYLNLKKVARSAAQALARDGRFCFNNFRKPRWFRKTYEFEKEKYFEAGWYVGRQVFHIQQKVGAGWDLTRFRWHTHEEVVQAMTKYFNVTVERTEKTNYYTCTVKYPCPY